MPRDTFNMGYASQHFNAVDISRYHLILIPVLVKQHWTLIVVDMTAKHIRYLNSGDEGGSDYLTIIKRWLANRWTATAPDAFKVDEWRCLSSHAAITPQQADTVNCGIFTLMFAECIVMGKDITSFSQSRCQAARWHIAKALIDHDVRPVPSHPDEAPINAAQY
jgi:Ulp1 family protease